MSNCEVTLLTSIVSLVWALCVRLAFLLVSVERSLVCISRFFFALIVGVGAASSALAHPVHLVTGCN